MKGQLQQQRYGLIVIVILISFGFSCKCQIEDDNSTIIVTDEPKIVNGTEGANKSSASSEPTITTKPVKNKDSSPRSRAEEDDLIELNEQNLARLINISENSILPVYGVKNVDLENWEAPYELRKYYPYYHAGYDDDGRPIWIAEIGKWNLRKVVEEGPENLAIFDKYVQQAAYRAVKSLGDRATPDNPVTDAVLISDMDQLNFIQMAHVPTVSYVLHLAREYQSLVEKHIHVGIAVNTNAVAHTLINLVKPVFGRIFEKVEVYGTNTARYVPNILKYCPKDQIPSWYGGTKDFHPIKVYG